MRLKDILGSADIEVDIDRINSAMTDDETVYADEEELGEFIPPLQQNLELMKKTAGVDSFYSDEEENDIACQQASNDNYDINQEIDNKIRDCLSKLYHELTKSFMDQ